MRHKCQARRWGVGDMRFKVEQKRSSIAQKYIVRCNSDIGGSRVVEERSVKGVAMARKTAEMLATSLNVTTTVYGTDSEGEFVYGVHEVADGAGNAASPLIKRLFVESAAGSLNFKDQLITNIPEETIKGFAAMSAALGYIVREHKQAKRTTTPQISYSTLFRVFCGEGEPATISLAFRGTVPETGAQFVMVIQQLQQNGRSVGNSVGSIGLVYREQDESAVIALMRRLLKESNPFKDRVVLVNRDLRTVRSRMPDRSWSDLIPHEQVRAELDFIAASIRNREMLKAEGLTIKRGLLLAGPPGDGKSAAIECFVNGIAGEATIIIVEAVEHIRAVYHLAQTLAPAVVILEDLDLMTKSRQNPYSYGAISQTMLPASCCRSCREAPLTPTLSRSPPPTIPRRSMKRSPSAPVGSTRMSGWVTRAMPTKSAFSTSIWTASRSTTISRAVVSNKHSRAILAACISYRRTSKNLSKPA
jgi:hypothetical protein